MLSDSKQLGEGWHSRRAVLGRGLRAAAAVPTHFLLLCASFDVALCL